MMQRVKNQWLDVGCRNTVQQLRTSLADQEPYSGGHSLLLHLHLQHLVSSYPEILS